MTETGKFKMTVALDRAWSEYLGLKEDERNPVQLMGLARRYAPRNIPDCLTALEENKHLFWLDAQAGMLLQDVITATATNWMFRVLLQKDYDYQQEKAAQVTKNLVTGAPLQVRNKIQRSKR